MLTAQMVFFIHELRRRGPDFVRRLSCRTTQDCTAGYPTPDDERLRHSSHRIWPLTPRLGAPMQRFNSPLNVPCAKFEFL